MIQTLMIVPASPSPSSLTRPGNVFSHFGPLRKVTPTNAPSPLCRALCVGISGNFVCPWLASWIFWPVPALAGRLRCEFDLQARQTTSSPFLFLVSHDTTFGGFHTSYMYCTHTTNWPNMGWPTSVEWSRPKLNDPLVMRRVRSNFLAESAPNVIQYFRMPYEVRHIGLFKAAGKPKRDLLTSKRQETTRNAFIL